MGTWLDYHDLLDVFRKPDCPICRLGHQAVSRYIDTLLWELVNDPGVRKSIRKARGFCQQHAGALSGRRAALECSIIMMDVVESVLEEAQSSLNSFQDGNSSRLAGNLMHWLGAPLHSSNLPLAPESECPPCRLFSQECENALSTLLDNLVSDTGMQDSLKKSDGLCLPHYRQAMEMGLRRNGSEVMRLLAEAQSEIWRRLREKLALFIQKNDYRFQDQPVGEEGTAWKRALTAMAGLSYQGYLNSE